MSAVEITYLARPLTYTKALQPLTPKIHDTLIEKYGVTEGLALQS